MSSATEKLETDKYEIYLLEGKLLYLHYFEDVEGNIEDIQESIAFQRKLGINEDYTRIVHAERYVTITKEAREYIEKNAPTVKAEAYIIESLAQKIIFNLYIKFRSNKHPLKAFNSLDTAKDWLNTY